MGAPSSTFLLIFHETSPARYSGLTYDERREALERWNAWCDDLAGRGLLQQGNTLAPEGRRVSAARGTTAMDGPFAEAKELIGGYMVLAAETLEEATAAAERCPNLRYGMEVEVRPIAQACHLARSLGRETMRGPADSPA